MPSGQTDTSFWQSQKRTIPIITTADLDEEIGDKLQTFLDDRLPPEPADCVVLFDAEGRGVWVGVDDDLGILRGGLVNALKRLEGWDGNGDGDVMDVG